MLGGFVRFKMQLQMWDQLVITQIFIQLCEALTHSTAEHQDGYTSTGNSSHLIQKIFNVNQYLWAVFSTHYPILFQTTVASVFDPAYWNGESLYL